MYKKVLVFLTAVFMLLSLSTSVNAQLCKTTSFYNAMAWTWEYYGPCSPTYNCLSYALGITDSWTWPWVGSPTDSQVTSYMATKGYSTSGTKSKIISYGRSSSAIGHFSKVLTSSTCLAKCGGLNILKHYSWNPYTMSFYYMGEQVAYGSKVRVYKTTPAPPQLNVSIYGPHEASTGETHTWCASVYGGAPPYTYEWKHSMGGPHYTYPWGNTECVEYEMTGADVYVKLTVTDSAGASKIAYRVIDNPAYSRKAAPDKLDNYITELEFAIKNSSYSSNPYDYINNDAFRKIVAMGPSHLAAIRRKILARQNNALPEYLLAIAAEKISAVNLKEQSSLWVNGKEWTNSWDNFLRILPAKVDSIINSELDSKDKNSKLEALGFAALPILEDKIREGNTSLSSPFNNLVEKLKISADDKLQRRAVSSEKVIDTYRDLLNRHK